MQYKLHPKRFTSVVYRLRSAFFSITLLILVASIIWGLNLKQLNESQDRAMVDSVPKLVYSQELESLASEVVLIQRGLTSALAIGNTSNIELEVDRLKDKANKLNQQIVKVGNLSTLEEASSELANATNTNQTLIPIVRSIEGIDVVLSALSKQLSEIRTKFLELSEPLLIETDLDINSKLRSLNSSDNDTYVLRRSILDSVKKKQAFSEISFRFLLVIQMSEDLSERNSSDNTDKISTSISQEIRNIAHSVVMLDENRGRSDIALMTTELSNIVFGERGVVNTRANRLLHQKEFETRQTLQVQRLNTVSNLISEVVQQARREIDESTKTFQDALFEIAITNLAIVLSILAIVSLVSYFVIEKQINSRLPRLTEAVLSIAKGENRPLADVRGEDELGAMGDSLDVFRKTAQQLRQTNHEMEQFAYAAAHDLRSPLRAIENLAQWIIEDSNPELSAQSREYLDKILERTKRLSDLQTDLLKYARAGHLEDKYELINTRDLCIELHELLDSNSQFQLIFSGKQEVKCLTVPLRQILLNLFQNAIKHHDTGQGTIEVTFSVRDTRLHVVVQDDGPGIPMAYQAKIFNLFQTLQPKDNVEGSGLGLALAQKLVERYDGNISVRSNPNQHRGTTFIFDMPVM